MFIKNVLRGTIVISMVVLFYVNAVREDEMVETWAGKLGDELWELGTTVTKSPEIRTSYTKLNARVLPTDGEGILNSILNNVGKLIDEKMNSLRCLISKSEYLSQNLTMDEVEVQREDYNYYNSIYSNVTKDEVNNSTESLESGKDEEEENEEDQEEKDDLEAYAEEMSGKYLEMQLDQDDYFYGIEVNTSYSSVHVPHFVFDEGNETLHSIMWSQGLDEEFIKNYESDSTISWQYFCSSTGILRHFPAYHWPSTDLGFDCRTRIWFTEAATCPKQVVIMVDRSGSMIGVKKTIAKFVVQTILQTLSQNDFLNIFVYNKTVEHIVKCFPNETLVQATPENLEMFYTAINNTAQEDKLFLEPALIWAFNVLGKTKKSCPASECTKAVFLITDGVAENVTHIFQKYNLGSNETELPSKVFVYVVGKEPGNEDLAKHIACFNRGHYAPIRNMEDVHEGVLSYVSFLAKPDTKEVRERTFTWSHLFVDVTGTNEEDEEKNEYRMMTSVIGSAFQWNSENSNQDEPTLLGVAGIDVLIEDIKKLTLPYKIGANGYAFLITNNGLIIFHPDHRPTERGKLKYNFNSIDLIEVELFDDNITDPRKPDEAIIKLREAMVMHEDSSIEDLDIKFHYDDMRRVGVESRQYHFAPLNNTPFSLGLVLPHSYGSYWIKAGDEIKKSIQMGVPLTDHFRGNFKIHPKWVYCDYHRTKLKFDTPEEKLIHFLEKMFNIHEWKWKDQFDVMYSGRNTNDPHECGEKEPIKENDYYCDKDLMQLLVFDAKVTENSYKDKDWSAKHRREEELVNQFGVLVRFVATQSGLTRWQEIPQSTSITGSFESGTFMTLEETWYKSAVLFHQTDPDAFVYSVPYDAGQQSDPILTASYAIFPRDGGNEAPGSVVGFQMLHSILVDRFKDITSKVQTFDTMETCASDSLDCYIIDSNGYIVVSEVANDTGKFFGEFEGAVMEAMVAKNIFRKIPMFDYQGLCFPDSDRNSGIDFLKTPFYLMKQAGLWFLAKLAWLMISMNHILPVGARVDPVTEETIEKLVKTAPVEDKVDNEVKPETCDKAGMLYLLQPASQQLPYSPETNCSRPFYVKRIPKTNLLLTVVNTLHQSCYRKLSTKMERILYENEAYDEPGCHKLHLNSLVRRRSTHCYAGPQDYEIPPCCSASTISTKIVSIMAILQILFYKLHTMFIS